MKSFLAWPLIAISLLIFSHSTKAADAATSVSPRSTSNVDSSSGWHFSASPYFWAAGIQGTVGQLNLPPADLKSDFGSILQELDFSFMGMAEGRRGPYSIFTDVAYTKTSVNDRSPKGLLTDRIDVTSEMFSGLFGGGYSLLANDRGYLDVIAGARVWYVSTELDLQGGLLNGKGRKDSATWVDAVAGFRGKYAISNQFYLTGWGNVGAGQAKLDWDVALALGYEVKRNISVVAGYRMLGVDYSKGGFVYDVVQKGPIIGLVFRL